MERFEGDKSEEITPKPEDLESTEKVESTEASGRQKLEDAATQPEALIEQRGDFQQAEAAQKIISEGIQRTDESLRVAPLGPEPRVAEGPYEEGPGKGDDGGDDITPINLPNIRDEVGGEAVSAMEVKAGLSLEQKEVLESLPQEDQEALLRLIGQSQRIPPDKLKGHSGGLIY